MATLKEIFRAKETPALSKVRTELINEVPVFESLPVHVQTILIESAERRWNYFLSEISPFLEE